MRILTVIEVLVATRADQMAGIAGTVDEINVEQHRWLQYLGEQSVQRLAGAGLTASSTVVDGDPKETLISEAGRWKADTVFVGARGLGVVGRLLLGSVSGAVVTHAPCTVEIVRNH